MDMKEGDHKAALQKLKELEGLLAKSGMSATEFAEQNAGGEDAEPSESPEGEDGGSGKKDPAKIALIIAKMKKNPEEGM